MSTITNEEFGVLVDCSESMASRLRSGTRRPGTDLRERIMRVFKFDKDLETMKAFNEAASDARLFGAFLRKHVFRDVEAA